jgi:type VI secretion system secreted protein VgrG
MPFTQQSDWIRITTPFGENKVLLKSFEGEERLSGLFRYELELISEDDSLNPGQIVGKDVTLSFVLPDAQHQYLNGIVGRFAQAGKSERFTTYYADLHPWLWLLTMKSDCRIFQNKTTPDIIKQVFSDLGFTDFRDSLTGTYEPHEYCVQYQETSLGFVSRLMEAEGIFYFFEHDQDKHTLVLADDPSAYGACPGLAQVSLRTPHPSREELDAILECSQEHYVTPGEYKSTDYNFKTPSTNLLAQASGSGAERSLYEYPGGYSTKDAGETLADKRLTALEARRTVLRGISTCRAFHAGCKFDLVNHYRPDVNASYALLWVSHRATQREYSNSFEAIPADRQYYPPRLTPRPKIMGTQTAQVVGKAGEEIWTDEYGRVKVKFRWDQSSAQDETCSCWVRVMQAWAGKLWGSNFIPRIGQEVVVSFLDGDPDRPLITGGVYNAEQIVPYVLPDEQTKSTIKTNSSKGGNGSNELRFEDKSGSEEIYLHAQKDLNVEVLNNQTVTVHKTRSATILEEDDKLSVEKGNRMIAVKEGNETHEVKGKRDLSVTGNETHTNQADFTQTVSGNFTLKVSGNLTIEVSGSVKIKAGTDLTNEAGTSLENKAGTDLTNEAGTSLTNKAGTTMSNEANISISSKANASHTVESSGMMVVKGAIVKIN